MEGEKPLTLEIFGDYRYVGWWAGCHGAELNEGEEDILVGFCSVGVVDQVGGIDGVSKVVVCAGEGLTESINVRADGGFSCRLDNEQG